jgi:hypothetical protein
MKSCIFWDITPCSPFKVNRRFGGTYRHRQGRRISHARNQRKSRWQAGLCSAGAKNKPNKKPGCTITLVSCLAYSSTLKMEATCSSETSIDFRRTTRRYIPEDGTLQNLTVFVLIKFYVLYQHVRPSQQEPEGYAYKDFQEAVSDIAYLLQLILHNSCRRQSLPLMLFSFMWEVRPEATGLIRNAL